MSAANHAAQTITLRTCNELGVCQAKPIPCQGCHHWLDHAADADATPGTFDQIAYWGSVAVVGTFTVATLAGICGYLVTKLGG